MNDHTFHAHGPEDYNPDHNHYDSSKESRGDEGKKIFRIITTASILVYVYVLAICLWVTVLKN